MLAREEAERKKRFNLLGSKIATPMRGLNRSTDIGQPQLFPSHFENLPGDASMQSHIEAIINTPLGNRRKEASLVQQASVVQHSISQGPTFSMPDQTIYYKEEEKQHQSDKDGVSLEESPEV